MQMRLTIKWKPHNRCIQIVLGVPVASGGEVVL
jgi:hypothetical protein